jgi:predicted PurR-regulated permease PerM
MLPSVQVPQQNLIFGTLGRALSAMWDLFWPLLLPLFGVLLLAFAAYMVRKFLNVG